MPNLIFKQALLFRRTLYQTVPISQLIQQSFKTRQLRTQQSVWPCALHPSDFLSDPLLLWLSQQLSEEDLPVLLLSLRLRRSATQLLKLRCDQSVSSQAFLALTMWRRGLPAASQPAKTCHLAECLASSGRPDLARELLLRQAAQQATHASKIDITLTSAAVQEPKISTGM